jgi:hypothetical protein
MIDPRIASIGEGRLAMKLRMVVAGLLCVSSVVGARAGEMECAEFPSGEVVCDDGAAMFYRPAGAAEFSRVDDTRRREVIAAMEALAAGGSGLGAGSAGDTSGARTDFVGPGQSITSDGDCVSASFPGGSFIGSGC